MPPRAIIASDQLFGRGALWLEMRCRRILDWLEHLVRYVG
jgi:hypothetical protein